MADIHNLPCNHESESLFGQSGILSESELGAFGLRPQIVDSHAAYLGHWVKILEDRPGPCWKPPGTRSGPAQTRQSLAA